MYEKNIFIVFCIIFCYTCFFTGCKTTRVVSDFSDRDAEYQRLQSEIRDGETGLARTGTELKRDLQEITETSGELRSSLERIEQSIRESRENEQDFGELLQRIENRKVDRNILIELKNRYPDIFNE